MIHAKFEGKKIKSMQVIFIIQKVKKNLAETRL